MISSDLSHFHDLTTARELDAATAKAIEALAPERLGPDNACGFLPIAGLLWNAGRSGEQGHGGPPAPGPARQALLGNFDDRVTCRSARGSGNAWGGPAAAISWSSPTLELRDMSRR